MQLWMPLKRYLSVLVHLVCLVYLHKALQQTLLLSLDLPEPLSRNKTQWVLLARIPHAIVVLRFCV
jgi:hypothetical protein